MGARSHIDPGFGRAPRLWAPRGSGLLLIAVLVVGCSTRGCGDTQFAVPTVKIYNRTLISVRFGDVWGAACQKTNFDLASWPSQPPTRMAAPANAVPLSVDLGVPSDYRGNVSIIVSEAGVEVIPGDISEDRLPRCAGVPPASVLPSPAG